MKRYTLLATLFLAGCRTAVAPPPNAIDHIEHYSAILGRSDNQLLTTVATILAIALIVILVGIRSVMRHREMQLRKDLLREERLAARRNSKS